VEKCKKTKKQKTQLLTKKSILCQRRRKNKTLRIDYILFVFASLFGKQHTHMVQVRTQVPVGISIPINEKMPAKVPASVHSRAATAKHLRSLRTTANETKKPNWAISAMISVALVIVISDTLSASQRSWCRCQRESSHWWSQLEGQQDLKLNQVVVFLQLPAQWQYFQRIPGLHLLPPEAGLR
jgi:hypothetical protein